MLCSHKSESDSSGSTFTLTGCLQQGVSRALLSSQLSLHAAKQPQERLLILRVKHKAKAGTHFANSSLARAASACRLQSGTRRAAKHADKGQTCETHLGRPGLLQTWGAKAGLRPAATSACLPKQRAPGLVFSQQGGATCDRLGTDLPFIWRAGNALTETCPAAARDHAARAASLRAILPELPVRDGVKALNVFKQFSLSHI